MEDEPIIPEIPKPPEDGDMQEPTRDVPTGRGAELDERLVASEHTPDDVAQAKEAVLGEEAEQSQETISANEVIDILRKAKEEGLDVDFEEEDIEHIQPMDEEERLGYVIDSLLNAGVEDPEAFLKEKGILE